ncbi:MAG: DUF4037 domain-containing protein, partial [bacterium]
MTRPLPLRGIELSRAFYEEGVRPVLNRAFPGLRHSAALLGSGSEVLGYDDGRSPDHDWGTRVQLFLSARDHARLARRIARALATGLPRTIRGHSTHWFPRNEHLGTGQPVPAGNGPVSHRAKVTTVRAFFLGHLGFDPSRGVRTADWLAAPQQRLLTVTAGAVHHDGLGALAPIRRRLAWYPAPVWRALLAAQWRRIQQEEPFPGRCAEAGDELGSRVVAARLVRDLMRLGFLLDRRYAPYSKWLGTAFMRLPRARRMAGSLRAVLAARTWPARERALGRACRIAARLQNALRLTKPVPVSWSRFHRARARVIHADRFEDALRATLPPGRLR